MPSDRVPALFCVFWPEKAESQLFFDNRNFPFRLIPKKKENKRGQTRTAKEKYRERRNEPTGQEREKKGEEEKGQHKKQASPLLRRHQDHAIRLRGLFLQCSFVASYRIPIIHVDVAYTR